MDGMTVLWIVLAAVAVVILVAVLVSVLRKSSKRKAERDRQEMHELQRRATTSEDGPHPDEGPRPDERPHGAKHAVPRHRTRAHDRPNQS